MDLTTEERSDLVHRAMAIRHRAYAPYSNYAVGAAILTNDGEVFEGVNIENASYPLSICAERTALFQAVSHGKRGFRAIAVATDNGGPPCGACRQVLSEFSLDMKVYLVDGSGEVTHETSVGELLPVAFTPDQLNKA
jgi:cytidine deaminase